MRFPWQAKVHTESQTRAARSIVCEVENRINIREVVRHIEVGATQVTVHAKSGSYTMPYDAAREQPALVAEKLLASRGDLLTASGHPAIVPWYRTFMNSLKTHPICHGMSLQISADAQFVRWNRGQLSGAVFIYGTDGRMIAELVVQDIQNTHRASDTTPA
jgi:hypothetical protein